MKLMILTRRAGSRMTEPPGLWTAPDSAIVLPGRPLFLPDFSKHWKASVAVAVKICRLGKSIPEKFAARYYDEVSLTVRLEPTELMKKLRASGEPDCLASAFDNCVQLGRWLPAEEVLGKDEISIECGETTIELSREAIATDKAIAAVSKYMTLRTGDIVCPAETGIEMPVEIGTTVTAGIDGKECVSMRVK